MRSSLIIKPHPGLSGNRQQRSAVAGTTSLLPRSCSGRLTQAKATSVSSWKASRLQRSLQLKRSLRTPAWVPPWAVLQEKKYKGWVQQFDEYRYHCEAELLTETSSSVDAGAAFKDLRFWVRRPTERRWCAWTPILKHQLQSLRYSLALSAHLWAGCTRGLG